MGQGVSAIRRHSNDHFYAAVQQGITLTTFLDIEIMKPFLNMDFFEINVEKISNFR